MLLLRERLAWLSDAEEPDDSSNERLGERWMRSVRRVGMEMAGSLEFGAGDGAELGGNGGNGR